MGNYITTISSAPGCLGFPNHVHSLLQLVGCMNLQTSLTAVIMHVEAHRKARLHTHLEDRLVPSIRELENQRTIDNEDILCSLPGDGLQ